MTTTNITSAAAHVQGLHAFIASEAKATTTDTQLEAAAGLVAGNPTSGGRGGYTPRGYSCR